MHRRRSSQGAPREMDGSPVITAKTTTQSLIRHCHAVAEQRVLPVLRSNPKNAGARLMPEDEATRYQHDDDATLHPQDTRWACGIFFSGVHTVDSRMFETLRLGFAMSALTSRRQHQHQPFANEDEDALSGSASPASAAAIEYGEASIKDMAAYIAPDSHPYALVLNNDTDDGQCEIRFSVALAMLFLPVAREPMWPATHSGHAGMVPTGRLRRGSCIPVAVTVFVVLWLLLLYYLFFSPTIPSLNDLVQAVPSFWPVATTATPPVATATSTVGPSP